jgi:hypothetical protein
MQVSDFYIRREARRLFERLGDDALTEARAKVRTYRAREDMLAADTWLRIIAALEELMREVAQ